MLHIPTEIINNLNKKMNYLQPGTTITNIEIEKFTEYLVDKLTTKKIQQLLPAEKMSLLASYLIRQRYIAIYKKYQVQRSIQPPTNAEVTTIINYLMKRVVFVDESTAENKQLLQSIINL